MKKILSIVCVLYAFAGSPALADNRAWVYIYDTVTRHYGYFIYESGSEWGEYDGADNKKKFSFTTVKDGPDVTVLFDKNRNTYVRLTRDACYLGHARDNIKEKFYEGRWCTQMGKVDDKFLKEKCGSYFSYEYKGIKHIIARPNGNPDIMWYDIDPSNRLVLETYTSQKETMDSVFLTAYHERKGYKVTKTGLFAQTNNSGTWPDTYTEMVKGKWSDGVSYNAFNTLETLTGDSLKRVMRIGYFSSEAIASKGDDSIKLKLAAASIASLYLGRIKKDKTRFLNADAFSVSVYDESKKELTIVYGGDMYNVPMTAADAAAITKNASKVNLTNRAYYFNGKRFKLSSFNVAWPGVKKSPKYEDKKMVMVQETLSIDKLEVTMPKS